MFKISKNRIYVVPYFKTVNTHLLLLLASAYSSSSSLYAKKISLSDPPSPTTSSPDRYPLPSKIRRTNPSPQFKTIRPQRQSISTALRATIL